MRSEEQGEAQSVERDKERDQESLFALTPDT
jgi:hypothetical protein